jgi:hypothetical protein
MDTIIYSSAATLLIGIFFETTRNINTLFVSNTKLIIRQGEQIQFLLLLAFFILINKKFHSLITLQINKILNFKYMLLLCV